MKPQVCRIAKSLGPVPLGAGAHPLSPACLEDLCRAEKARVVSRYRELLGDAQRAPMRKIDKTCDSLLSFGE